MICFYIEGKLKVMRNCSGKNLTSGRFRPEQVAGLNRNGWQLSPEWVAGFNRNTQYERDIINKVSYSSAMASFKYFRNNRIQEMLRSSGFNEIDTIDITNNVAPSVYRVKRYFNLPYSIVKLLRLQQNFPNLTGVIEFSKLGEKDLMKCKIISAQK